MIALKADGQFELKNLPIIGPYNVQRFPQWSPESTSNWYVVNDDKSKQPSAMYPCMGRSHINYLGVNRLVYGTEPRSIFKTIDYYYVIVGSVIYRGDRNYNEILLTGLQSLNVPVYFTMLVVNSTVYACFVDDQKIYIHQENTTSLQVVTDPLAPGNSTVDGVLTKPGFISTFGNRLVVSVAGSSQYYLSAVNLAGKGAVPVAPLRFDPSKVFTNFGPTPAIFALEEGIIRQMGVLNTQLYILCDYTTGVWANTPSRFSGTDVTFPFKRNSTYSFNFGIANPTSLDIDFGMMVWLARNSDGLLQFMATSGGQPNPISDKSISTLLQKYVNALGINNPFLVSNSNGFLYQYENTIFYRMSGGDYTGTGILDQTLTADSMEYSFESGSWQRCIELNGERSRVKNHVYFNFKHLVTLTEDNTVYDLSGQYYYNEIRNPAQPNPQEQDAYLQYPIRYERTTGIVYLEGYAEFETEYVQIDFVFGDSNINFSTNPFENAQFLIAEQQVDGEDQYMIAENPDSDGEPIYIIADEGNTPDLNSLTYNSLYNPHIELFFSDDGGISYESADVRVFSQMGQYNWRMRWYQLGCSRNRSYQLVCVSRVPVVPLGAVMNVRRTSGGAN